MNARNIASISALTPIQEGILFHALADNARQVYHSQFSARIDGQLDATRWREAWDKVIARHDTLRTLFTWEGRDKPLQIVREHVPTPWQTLDWSEAPAQDHESMLHALLERDRDLGFELDRAPLLRLVLIDLGPGQHRFVFTFHHLILDGWSMRLVLNEAQQIYADHAALGEHAPSFTRFVEWQAKRDASGDEAWWRERLASFDTPVFPDVHDGSENDNASHHLAARTLDSQQVETLTRVAREQRVTPSSVVAAAWALLLSRYADTNDVVFGTTASGRPPELAEVEHIAGMFINTLPLRIRIRPEATVADFLQQVQSTQVEQRDMEPSALGTAQRASGVAPGEPLFESILVYENFPAAPDTQAREIALQIDHFVEYSHFPLAILAVPDESFALIGISDPERMSSAALNELMDNLVHTVVTLLADVRTPVAQVATLDPVQRQRVVVAFNDTAVNTPEPRTLWHQMAACAANDPQATALIDADGALTYSELMAQAGAVSSTLLERDVAAGDPILIIGPRDRAAVTAIVGVHGAGAAYVPVPADAPDERVAQIVAELERLERPVRALITGASSVTLPGNTERIPLPETTSPGAATLTGPGLDHAAYYMFTSGSTGTPKGVAILQRNLYHSVHARDVYYAGAPSAFALLSTLATDSSVAGLFWTLGRGATLVLPADRAEQDIAGLVSFLDRHRVSHLLTVPSLYSVLLEHAGDAHLSGLDVAIVAGEACPDALVAAHTNAAPQRELHNEYGPTETTVWCSAARLHAGVPVSIGRPLANTQTYVLDTQMRPVPVGVSGELYVGGPQVAQGYVGDPERTEKQFVPSAFAGSPRLYRTGDRVRWSPEGTLAFVGRVDDQIKVRGFRVEPGEIEACLMAQDGVAEAAVLLHQATPNTPLVAFVAATPALDISALRQTLSERLPNYMVPQHIEVQDALPRTAAGKVDRRQLATAAINNAPTSAAATPPATQAEQTLAAIWCDVLGISEVGIHDDFFALGGDSLLSIRVLARAGKAGLRIAPADFFAWPTVAGQAAHADHSGARKVAQKPWIGPQALMPIQHWFFRHIQPGASQWNLSYRFDLHTAVQIAQVRRAVAALLTTHDTLRSGFERDDTGQWTCRVHAPQEVDVVSEKDFSGLGATDIGVAVQRTADELNASFDLAAPPLIRVALIHTPAGQPQQLLVIVHHLIVDAESWRILIEDLETALTQASQNNNVVLPEKTDSLATFSKRLVEWSREDAFNDTLTQWQAQLAPTAPDLAPEASAPATFTEGQCQQHVIRLGTEDTRALLESTTDTRATVLELLLTGVASALGQHLAGPRVRFEIEGHGRDALFDDLDLSRTVGWMTTAFPLTVRQDGDWHDASGVLRQVKHSLRELPHRGLSYGVIMASGADTPVARHIQSTPRAAVLFNYLGERERPNSARLLQLVDERCGQARASDAPRAYLLEMNAMIEEGCLNVHMVYPQPAFAKSTIDALGAAMGATLRTLAGGASDAVVPQDFPLANLDEKGLSDLSDLLDELDD